MDKFTEATKKAEDTVSKSEKSFSNFTDLLAGIGSAVTVSLSSFKALQKVMSGFTSFLKSTISTSAQYESMLVNLSVVLGDATQAQREFNQLREMASKTPFSAEGLTDVVTQLHAVGLESRDAMDMLTKFATVAMGDTDKLQRMANNYAQIVSVGKASSIDMKQFAQMGLPVYQMMQEMQITGQATADQVKEMFVQMTSEGGKFFGGLEKGASTATASLNAVRDNFQALSASIGDQFQPALKDLYNMTSKILAFATDNPVVTGAILSAVTALGVALAGSLVVGARAGIVALKALAVQATATGAVLSAMGKAVPIIGVISTALGLAVGAYSTITNAIKNANEEAENQAIALANQNKELREFIDLSDKVALRNAQKHDKLGTTTELEDIALLELELKQLEEQIGGYDEMFKRMLQQGQSLSEATATFNKYNMDSLNALIEKRTALMQEIDARKANVEKANEELLAQERITQEVEKQKQAYADMQTVISQAYSRTEQGRIDALLAEYTKFQQIVDNPVARSYWSNESGTMREYKVTYTKEEIEQARASAQYYKEQYDNAVHNQNLYKLGENQGWRQDWLNLVGISNEDFYNKTGTYLKDANPDSILNALLDELDPNRTRNKLIEIIGDEGFVDVIMPKESLEDRAETLTSMLERLKTIRTQAIIGGFYDGWDFSDRESNRGKEGLYRANQIEDAISSLESELDIVDEELSQINNAISDGKLFDFGSTLERGASQRRALSDAFSSTGVGVMASDYAEGGKGFLEGGIFNDAIYQFTAMLMSIENVNKVLNPIGTVLDGMKKIIEPLIDDALEPIVDILTSIGESLGTVISPVLTVISAVLRVVSGVLSIVIEPLRLFGELMKWVNDSIIVPFGNALIWIINGVINALNKIPFVSIPLVDNLKKMDDVVTSFNKDAKDLTAEYEKLLSAMRDQEAYYISKKQNLVGSIATDKLMGVNDMILTPNGGFSTHPDDYIIATKNPQSLGSTTVNVEVNNTVSNDVDAEVENVIDENGIAKLIVNISKKIASDASRGANGWDNALTARSLRLAGRSF